MLSYKILIIDDHMLFADGLELMLSELKAKVEVDRSTRVKEEIDHLETLDRYDLIIVDLHLPELDGFSFLRAVQSHKLHVRTVVVSGTDSQNEIERAIGLGASGFISKDSSKKEMLLGIQTVLNGKRYLPHKWLNQISWFSSDAVTHKNPMQRVGPRQLDVLKMMGDGLQNKQIAAVLGISVSAVKSHIRILFDALNVRNRSACVQVGIQKNLI